MSILELQEINKLKLNVSCVHEAYLEKRDKKVAEWQRKNRVTGTC